MIRKPVRSSCFSSIGYDEGERILEVEYRSNGSVYSYANIPVDLYNELVSALSIGRYFHRHIANKYYYVGNSYDKSSVDTSTLSFHKPASREDLKHIYYKLSHRFHPDKVSGHEELMKQINNLYQEQNLHELKEIATKYGLI